MIICPLCEHVQERGTVCDNCGKQLFDSRRQPVAVAPLDGLETGKLGDADLTGRFSEENAADAISQTTIVPPREPFTLEELGGESSLSKSSGSGNALVRCKICGQIQPEASVTCSACGARLPRLFAKDAADDSQEKTTCRHCGVRVVPVGGLCPSCGARFPSAS